MRHILLDLRKFDWLLGTTRFIGILLIISAFTQLFSFIYGFNYEYPLFSLLFLSAFFLHVLSIIIAVLNSWFYKEPDIYQVNLGFEPTVAILIPTMGEPISMILKTLKSVLFQNWPLHKMIVVISDDGNRKELRERVQKIQQKYSNVLYVSPPEHGSVYRPGDAKAGNLNSALSFVLNNFPDVEFIETRDSDDLVADPDFLRLTVGSLLADKQLHFVQTIKRAKVSKGDPFFNQEKLFYEQTMHYRNAVNAAFPCGSGLVWRKKSLLKIGGFPTWNLVEDLHSGYESYKRGGKGEYLPIVGAISQSAPEDIPNYYKQRGTWAIDSLRLFFWDNPLFAKGLSFWQRLQFFELGYGYLISCTLLLFVFTISSCLTLSVCPVNNYSPFFLLSSVIFIYLLELYNILRSRGVAYKELWNARQNWIGLMPVFIVSLFKALIFGPNNKPSYVVTRKKPLVGFYGKDVSIQLLLILVLVYSLVFKVFHYSTFQIFDVILIFWAMFLIIGFARVVNNAWYGFSFNKNIKNAVVSVFESINLGLFTKKKIAAQEAI